MDGQDAHLMEVSKVVKYTSVHKLPKFSHANMAVINPIHKERKSESPSKSQKIKIVGSPAKIKKREVVTKLLPDHLIRPPPEVLMESIPRPKTAAYLGNDSKRGKGMTEQQWQLKKKQQMENRKKLDSVKANSIVFFKECSNKLNQINEEEAKTKETQNTNNLYKGLIGTFFSKQATGIKKLYNKVMGSKVEKLTRVKFIEFAKIIMNNQKLGDTDLKDMFNHYCKKNKKPKEEEDAKNKSLKRRKTFYSSIKSTKTDKTDKSKKDEDKEVDKKLEMEALNINYEEWLKQEENLSGVLNTKTLNLKNLELKEKINYWRDSIDIREQAIEKLDEKQKQLYQILSKYHQDLSIEKDKVETCVNDFTELIDNRKKYMKNERILNDFLLNLKEFKILEIRDMRKTMDNYRIEKGNEHAMLTEFVDKICRECVLNHHYFSFFDIPDMILKMTPNKVDYKKMIDLLNVTKAEYIKEKAEIIKKPIDEVRVTDEDLVPLELIKQVLNQQKFQFKSDCEYIFKLINEIQEEVNSKIRQLQVENTKIKKIIENNVFVAHLNQVMEDNHKNSFLLSYKVRLLHMVLAKTLLKSAKEVSDKYFNIVSLNPTNNKEIHDKLIKEMSMFSNKATFIDGASDTISDLTEDKLTKVFKRLGAMRDEKQTASDGKIKEVKDEEDSLAAEEDLSKEDPVTGEVKFDFGKILSGRTEKDSLNDKELEQMPDFKIQPIDKGLFDSFKMDKFKRPDPPSFDNLEEEDEEDREAIEERKRKEAEEAAWMAKYIGKLFYY